MMLRKSKLKILIPFLCIPLIFGGLFVGNHPQKANANQYVPVLDQDNLQVNEENTKTNKSHKDNYYDKEYERDGYAWVFVKKIINMTIVEELLSWVKEGYYNEASFIKNPSSFFSSMGEGVFDQIISQNFDFLCDDFSINVSDAIEYKYVESRDMEKEYSCTLDDAVANLQNHYDDFVSGNFYHGGWEGFYAISQNPKNNPYGAYLQAENDMENEVSRISKLAELELGWGDGFFSTRDGDNISMPGDVLTDQLSEVLSTDIRQLEHADELTEMIAMLVGQLVSNVITGNDGLLSGSSNYEDPGEPEDYEPVQESHDPDEYDDVADGPAQITQTFSGMSFTADISDANIQIDRADNQKSLEDITLNASRMIVQEGQAGDTISTGGLIEVDEIDFRYFAGDYEGTLGNTYPQGELQNLTNVRIRNPVFQTIEGVTSADTGGQEVNDIHYLGSLRLQGNAYESNITNATVEGDDSLSEDNLEGGYIREGGEGSSIGTLENIDPYTYGQTHPDYQYSFENEDLRGGVVDNPTIDRVRIVGGEIVDSNGNVLTDGSGNPYVINSNLYCGYSSCGTSNFEASGVTGDSLEINDTSGSGHWSYTSYGWPSPKDATVNGSFQINYGVIENHY